MIRNGLRTFKRLGAVNDQRTAFYRIGYMHAVAGMAFDYRFADSGNVSQAQAYERGRMEVFDALTSGRQVPTWRAQNMPPRVNALRTELHKTDIARQANGEMRVWPVGRAGWLPAVNNQQEV